MEEEYRMHKAKEDNRKSTAVSSASADKLSQKLKDATINDDESTLNGDVKEENESAIPEASVEKPKQVAEDDEQQQENEVTFTFGNKRLCERWLDNLFMVLYEDLRVYTFWRTEAAHYRAQKTAYRKTGTEWELLGDLALRLWKEVENIYLYITGIIY
jgi:hypothetical protein